MEQISYPLGLINWSGTKKGGVRQPFQEDSGRPLRKQLKTPLVKRLESWVKGIVAGDPGLPRAILLVGGPGNGKTDAVEGCIQSFDSEICAGGELYSAFAQQYEVEPGILPPRRSEVQFPGISSNDSGITPVIRLVQDATEKDSAIHGASAESLLLSELREILDGTFKGIYICCVNRGILANTASLANRENDTEMTYFLNRVVEAASGGPSAPSCWPLDNKEVALWPMDVESLVSSTANGEKKTVAHEILDSALEDEKWQPFCENKKVCPFCQNKILLSKPKARDNLIKFLHYYELSSGKRWTFRDLYSLVSYILIGDPSTLSVGGKTNPCGWTAKQLQLIAKNDKSPACARAPYLLASKLYHHRLFSNWPRLTTGKHYKARKAVLADKGPKSEELSEGFTLAQQHFQAIKSLANSGEHNSISELLTTDFTASLDPALLHGEHVLFSKSENGSDVTVNLLEEHFSLSVKDGLELVKRRLTSSESTLLERLAKADEALFDHHYSLKVSKHARLLQASIRQFAARFTKRSLGLRYGIPKDPDLFQGYAELYGSNSRDKKVERLVRKLVNENDKSFKIPLSTTFGQPIAHRDRNISLVVNRIRAKLEKFPGDESRPAERNPYIKVHNRHIPVTFSLYKALGEIEEGLDEASLPQEVFALINEVKSITAGQVAKDDKFIDGSVELEIGQEKYTLEIDDSIQFLDEYDD